MTAKDLARIGDEMRHAQRKYRQTNSDSALKDQDRLEKKFDRCVARVLDDSPKLFETD